MSLCIPYVMGTLRRGWSDLRVVKEEAVEERARFRN